MTQIAVRKESKNVMQKIVDVAKPGYVKKSYSMLEPLQKANGDIVKTGSRWDAVSNRIFNKAKLTFVFTFLPLYPTMTMIMLTSVGDFSPTMVGSALIWSALFSLTLSSIPTYFGNNMSIDSGRALKKLKTIYREDVKAWLYDKYKITTNDTHLDEITSKIVTSTEDDYMFKDANTGHWHTMELDTTNNTWTITKLNSKPAANILQLESSDRIENPRIDAAFNAVNKKIVTLQQFTLTSEDDYLFAKAVNDTHATVNLANQLERLGDTEYADKAEQAFKLIEADLDAIIENQKKEVSGRFRAQHNTILNRT